MLKIHTEKTIIFTWQTGNKGSKYFNDCKAFTEYSNNRDIIYKNIEEYSPDKKHEILIVFNDMIADMLSNKKIQINSNCVIC